MNRFYLVVCFINIFVFSVQSAPATVNIFDLIQNYSAKNCTALNKNVLLDKDMSYLARCRDVSLDKVPANVDFASMYAYLCVGVLDAEFRLCNAIANESYTMLPKSFEDLRESIENIGNNSAGAVCNKLNKFTSTYNYSSDISVKPWMSKFNAQLFGSGCTFLCADIGDKTNVFCSLLYYMNVHIQNVQNTIEQRKIKLVPDISSVGSTQAKSTSKKNDKSDSTAHDAQQIKKEVNLNVPPARQPVNGKQITNATVKATTIKTQNNSRTQSHDPAGSDKKINSPPVKTEHVQDSQNVVAMPPSVEHVQESQNAVPKPPPVEHVQEGQNAVPKPPPVEHVQESQNAVPKPALVEHGQESQNAVPKPALVEHVQESQNAVAHSPVQQVQDSQNAGAKSPVESVVTLKQPAEIVPVEKSSKPEETVTAAEQSPSDVAQNSAPETENTAVENKLDTPETKEDLDTANKNTADETADNGDNEIFNTPGPGGPKLDNNYDDDDGDANFKIDDDAPGPDKEQESPVPVIADQSISPREYADVEDSNFFAYFMFISVMFIAGYVVYHNKQKILALVLEGRRDRNSRRRPNTASYRKLNSNLEEAVTSKCSGSAAHVIY